MRISYESVEGGVNNLVVIESCGVTTSGKRGVDAVIASHSKRLNKKLEKKTAQRITLSHQLYESQLRDHDKLARVGWGAAMRGYKCNTMKFTRTEGLEERIKNTDSAIADLKAELESI